MVLFFDIDGTLITFQGEMPESAKRALRQAKENGHSIVICSGRPVHRIPPEVIDIGFDGFVAAAGAHVESAGKTIYDHCMKEPEMRAVRELLERAGACYLAHAKEQIIATADGKRRFEERAKRFSREKRPLFWRNMEIDENWDRRQDIQKVTFHESAFPVWKIREELAQYCDVTEISFEKSFERDGEISSRGINKALGMQKYIEYLGIPREDTVAFGDGPNDFEMLEFVHTGVAMGNASDDLKRYADYVTKAIDDDGIAYALEELGLIGK